MPEPTAATNGNKSDRVAGVLLVVIALLIGLVSRTFTVGFVTDPLGPRAFPLVSAFLLLLGGVALLFRPGADSTWPRAHQLMRVAMAAICLLAYAMLLDTLGFCTTTWLVVAVFALQLGGRPVASLLSAAGISAALYLLFFYLLDIALPLGSLFVRGG